MKTEHRGAPRRLRAVVGAIASLALAFGFATLGSSAASAAPIVTEVPIGDATYQLVAISPDGSTAYALGLSSGAISKIDVATKAVLDHLSTGYTGNQDMQLSADGSTLYITSQNAGGLVIVDTATLTVSSVIVTGTPLGLAVNDAETVAYVGAAGPGNVWEVDLTSGTVVATLTTGPSTWNLALSPDEQRLFTTSAASNFVRVFDTTSRAEIAAINVGAGTFSVDVSPDGNQVYASTCGQGVVIVDTTTMTFAGSVTAGLTTQCSFALAYSPDGSAVYFQAFDGSNPGAVDVIDPATSLVVDTFPAVGTAVSNSVRVAADGTFLAVGVYDAIVFVEFPTPPVFGPDVPSSGTVGEPYTPFAVPVTGSGPITFAVTSGALPPGLSFDPVSGEITGTPTTVGAHSFEIEATGPGGVATKSYTITVGEAPVITGGPASPATEGVAYSGSVTATGSPALAYAVSGGVLPPGLALDAVTGAITGTPTEAGSWTVEFTVSNAYGADSETFTITVGEAPVITGGPASPATEGVAYSGSVTATGTAPLAFAVSGGVLPPGLTLDAVTGAITGTPTEAGSWTVEFTVTNAYGADSESYTLVVDPPAGTAPTITSGPTATSTVGVSYVSSVTAIGSPELLFEVTTGELPAGLSMDPATGIITGSPTEAGTWEFVVTVSNEFGSDTGEYTIVSSAVAPTPSPTPGPNDDHSSLAFTGSGPTVLPLFVGGGLVLAGAAAIGATLIARRRATL